MEYVQEAVTTLHDFGDAYPPAPTERAAVVVPMTERDHAALAAERVLRTLEELDLGRVVVPLRAGPDEVSEVVAWVDGFDVPSEVVWCTAPAVESALADAGLDGTAGKGRDVWLGLGAAIDGNAEYVVVHDADATTYSRAHVPRLLHPVANGFDFAKGYYARVENDRIYGRLCRLFYEPLVRALAAVHDNPAVEYFGAFRYALAGEFAATTAVAEQLRAQRGWGLEIGTLGEAFDIVGGEGTAQVDLGVHEHDHRSVGGPDGLGDMCIEVGAALFRALGDNGVELDYGSLRERYREHAYRLVDQYAADAGFNGLDYDPVAEREQVDTYTAGVTAPDPDDRLPAWRAAPLDPAVVRERSAAAIAEEG